MAHWAFILTTVGGEQLGELIDARNRQLKFDLRGAHGVTWSIDGRADMAREIKELATDVFAYRDGQLMFRGRAGSTDDDIDADEHQVSCSAVDYRGLLERRNDRWGRQYDFWNQNDLAWDMLSNVAQQGAGGALPITQGVRGAEVTRIEQVDVDTAITAVLDRFQDYGDGFEWELTPAGTQLVFNRWTWRGLDRPDFPLVWSVTGPKVSRKYDTALYANWVRVRGGKMDKPPDEDEDPSRTLATWSQLPAGAKAWDAYWVGSSKSDRVLAVWAANQLDVAPPGANPAWSWQAWDDMPTPYADRWASDLATRPEGQIHRVVTNSDLKSQNAVNAAADALLVDSLQVPAAYTATLDAELWRGPDEAWLGDRLPIVVRSGRLAVATAGRVYGVDISISDDDDSEEVTMTFGEVRVE